MPPAKTLHIAMLVDAWFPGKYRGVGVFGGGQVHVSELAKRLESHHHCKVTLFYPAHPNIIIRAFWSFFVIAKLVAFSKRQPFHLLHSHGFNSGFPAKITSLILKIPVIHTVHGSANLDQSPRSLLYHLEKWLLTGITYDSQITVAAKFLDYPNNNRHVHVIPNGVNVAEFNQVRVKKYESPSIIWVGRQDKVKGVDVLKRAVLKVRKKIPKVRTNLVTGGRLYGKNLIRAYKKAHVFVLSSFAEGQPITLLEAWAAKLPVVVTAVGDNPLMVKDGVNGYLVEPGNVKQLADAIIKVLRSRSNDVKMGQAGYNYVSKHHHWDAIVAKTHHVYEEVLMRRYQPKTSESKKLMLQKLKGGVYAA
jgi:glycosyltransferase involved in cell wall biosynthesis